VLDKGDVIDVDFRMLSEIPPKYLKKPNWHRIEGKVFTKISNT